MPCILFCQLDVARISHLFFVYIIFIDNISKGGVRGGSMGKLRCLFLLSGLNPKYIFSHGKNDLLDLCYGDNAGSFLFAFFLYDFFRKL